MTVVLRDERARSAVPVAVSRRAVIGACAGTVVVAFFAALLVAFVFFHAHHGFARTLARAVPFPAAVVDGRVVWYREVVAYAHALEALAGVAHDNAINDALLRAERRAVLLSLAERLGVDTTVRPEEEERARTALGMLATRAGWTEADLQRYAVEPYVLAARVEQAALLNASLQSDARATIEKLEVKLAEGIAFADLATQYSEGETASAGGDLGYIDLAALPEALRAVAMTLAVGETSGIVETSSAYWLLMAEEVIETEEGTRSVRLRVIERKKDLLGAVVDRVLSDADVRIFLANLSPLAFHLSHQ